MPPETRQDEPSLHHLRTAIRDLVDIDAHFKHGTVLGYRGESPVRRRATACGGAEETESDEDRVVMDRVNRNIRATVERRALFQKEEDERRALNARLGGVVDALIRRTVANHCVY